MIDNRTKSIPTSSSEVGIYYVYISQGNKDNGVYIVSDFVLPITVTKIAELYIGDNTKANLTGGNTFTGDQIINGDITVEDITATNFLGNASTATKLKTFVNINEVAFDGSSNITIYDGTKEATITPGNTSQYFRGDKTWQTLNKIVVGLSNVDNTADANKNVLSATKLTIPRTINNVTFDGSENIVINAIDITPRIPISYMGIANGVATLDSNGIIPITQLPSYVDDVIEVANYASLPVIGESGKIYVTTNNNKTYRWSGSVYVYITSGAVDSVNGYTGVVVLTKSDFILGNVDNTSDANKPISIATQGALDLKQNLLTLGNFTSTTPGITISNGNGAVIGSGITFNITTAGATTGGLITSGHWNTFNNKWDSSNHPITTLGYGLPDYPTTLPASDVYSWAKQSTKPTYSYSEITSKPTLLSQFTNDLGNYGGWITGINSGMVTTALGYTPWNTGNHPTTVSGYGITDIPTYNGSNFILNQNTSAQSANMWISGTAKIAGGFVYDSNTSNLNFGDTVNGGYIILGGVNKLAGDDGSVLLTSRYSSSIGGGQANIKFRTYNGSTVTTLGTMTRLGVFDWNGAATFASTVTATQLIANGVNTGMIAYGNYSVDSNYNAYFKGVYGEEALEIGVNGHKLITGGEYTSGNVLNFYTNNTKNAYYDYLGNYTQLRGNSTHSGNVQGNQLQSTVATGTAPLTVNSTTMVGNLNSQYLGGLQSSSYLQNFNNTSDLNSFTESGVYGVSSSNANIPANATPYGNVLVLHGYDDTMSQLYADWNNNNLYLRGGTPTNIGGSGSLSSWQKLYHSGNLTNNLSTNYIPKWNGSSFVNSLISDDGSSILLSGNIIPSLFGNPIRIDNRGGSTIFGSTAGSNFMTISNAGLVNVLSTTPSTSPTNGALVVNGGIGANHVRANNFYGALTGNASTATNVAYSGLTGTVPTWNQNTNGSAATLATSRTIWGQSFNGSNNISGAITGATTGTFSGDITANNYIGKSNGFYTVQITQAAYNALGTKDASTIYMIVG